MVSTVLAGLQYIGAGQGDTAQHSNLVYIYYIEIVQWYRHCKVSKRSYLRLLPWYTFSCTYSPPRNLYYVHINLLRSEDLQPLKIQ